jgi:two-component system LytT family response regulator
MPISVLIVDDEPLARDGLRQLLASDPDIGPIYVARGGAEAVELLRSVAPELVLLDVQMPEVDGFGVISAVGVERMPAVVFVTAHDHYAIAAFEISAVDYVLKPVTAARMAVAMARAKAHLAARSAEEVREQLERRVSSLLDVLAMRSIAGAVAGVVAAAREAAEGAGGALAAALGEGDAADAGARLDAGDVGSGARPDADDAARSAAAPRGPSRVAVRDGDRSRFFAIDEIEYFQGAENYVELHLCRDPAEVHLLQVTMNALERSLDPERFLRVHRSTIVQLARIAALRPTAHGEYQIELVSGARVRSGRTYQERVRRLLRNPF